MSERANKKCGYCVPCFHTNLVMELLPGATQDTSPGSDSARIKPGTKVQIRGAVHICRPTCEARRKNTKIPTGPFPLANTQNTLSQDLIGKAYLSQQTICLEKIPSPLMTGMNTEHNFLNTRVCCNGTVAPINVDVGGGVTQTNEECTPCCDLIWDTQVGFGPIGRLARRGWLGPGVVADNPPLVLPDVVGCFQKLVTRSFVLPAIYQGPQNAAIFSRPDFRIAYKTTIWNLLSGLWSDNFFDAPFSDENPRRPGEEFPYPERFKSVPELGCECPPNNKCC